MRRLNIILLYNLELGGWRRRMRRLNIILLYNLELGGWRRRMRRLNIIFPPLSRYWATDKKVLKMLTFRQGLTGLPTKYKILKTTCNS